MDQVGLAAGTEERIAGVAVAAGIEGQDHSGLRIREDPRDRRRTEYRALRWHEAAAAGMRAAAGGKGAAVGIGVVADTSPQGGAAEGDAAAVPEPQLGWGAGIHWREPHELGVEQQEEQVMPELEEQRRLVVAELVAEPPASAVGLVTLLVLVVEL